MWNVLSQTALDGWEGFGSHFATLGHLLENHSAGSSQHWDPPCWSHPCCLLSGGPHPDSHPSMSLSTQMPTSLYFPHKLTGGPNG